MLVSVKTLGRYGTVRYMGTNEDDRIEAKNVV